MTSIPAGPIRGILFDKDGTLVDFRSQWLPAYRAAAAMLAESDGQAERLLLRGGYDPVANHLDPTSPLACGTTRQIVEVWAADLGVPADEALVRRVEAVFHEIATRHAQPITDLARLFGRLKTRGIAIGVATMDSTATATANLEDFGVGALVDFVAGADAGHGIKPHPGMLLAFCRDVGFRPQQAVMVGDSVLDLMMGRNAGAGLVIGVLSGVTPREALARHADLVLASVAEIEDALP